MTRFIHIIPLLPFWTMVVLVQLSISYFAFSQVPNPPPITGPTQIDCAPISGTYSYNTTGGYSYAIYSWVLYDPLGNIAVIQNQFSNPPVNSPVFHASFHSNGFYKLLFEISTPFPDGPETDYDPFFIQINPTNNAQLTGDYNSGTNQTIRASQQITSSSFSFIHLGAMILAKTGNSIVLSPNFTSQSGSEFTAMISSNTCQNTRLDVTENQPLLAESVSSRQIDHEGLNDGISVFPNPSNGVIVVGLFNGDLSSGDLNIYNAFGESVYSTIGMLFYKETYPIYLSHLPNGMYTIEFKASAKKTWKKQFILNK